MDEINFRQIFKNLVRFRYTFALVFGASISVGVAILSFSKEVFMVKAPFEINFQPLESIDLCGVVTQYNNLIICLDAASLRDLGEVLGPDWDVAASKIVSLATTDPATEESYLAVLEKANDVLTQKMFDAAQLDIGVVQNSQLEAVQVSEYAAESFLHATRIVSKIKGGEKAFRFDTPEITKIYPSANLVMLAALMIGLALGLLGVAVRAKTSRA